FTGPSQSADYFQELDAFLKLTLGEEIGDLYEIVIDDAEKVGRCLSSSLRDVKKQRRRDGDAYYFNWLLKVPTEHQQPFKVNHDTVSGLCLSRDLPAHQLVVNLRRAFSAIVTGNIKDYGTRMIEQDGPFELRGDAGFAEALDQLLRQFVSQGRMKLAKETYHPCYRVIPE
ncbi:MAG: DUF3412 domain-containing protein, partial [Gammaproteobacteria bacterium]|nr:DUF3412 domain-containing protein [Gammaproteobacteria bacterium]